MQVNRNQKNIAFARLQEHYGSELNNQTVAIWGLAFKPNTDDIREAPALYLIDQLLEIGCKVRVFDPEAMENVKAIYGDKLYFARDQYDALIGSSCLMIITEWSVFRNPDFDFIKSQIGSGFLFDGRNLFDTSDMLDRGFTYSSIGRPASQSW